MAAILEGQKKKRCEPLQAAQTSLQRAQASVRMRQAPFQERQAATKTRQTPLQERQAAVQMLSLIHI